jgi:hypothetical protein
MGEHRKQVEGTEINKLVDEAFSLPAPPDAEDCGLPEEIFRQRTPSVTKYRMFRALTLEVRISTNCPQIDDSLKYIVPNALHEFPLDHQVTYEVHGEDDSYSVFEEQMVLAEKITRDGVLPCLFESIQKRMLGAMPDRVRIHAGCGSYRTKRFLVIGDKYAGKSTLMTRLLFSGFDVFGDESVLMRSGIVMPVPRKFYLREGSFRLLPQLAEIIHRLPFVNSASNGRVVAFEPRDAGFEWRLAAAPVDAIFALVPSHGEPTRLESCPKYRMVAHVIKESNPPPERSCNWIGDICAMVDSAQAYELHIGDLDQAVDILMAALTSNVCQCGSTLRIVDVPEGP